MCTREAASPEHQHQRQHRPHLPCPQVVEQVVADFRLFLIQLGEKVQKQRKAAVVLLHLAQVPRWGEESYHLAHTLSVGSPPNTEIASGKMAGRQLFS